jgi:hypothetical protein
MVGAKHLSRAPITSMSAGVAAEPRTPDDMCWTAPVAITSTRQTTFDFDRNDCINYIYTMKRKESIPSTGFPNAFARTKTKS